VDTSHAAEFTKVFLDPKGSADLAGFKVVAAFPGGSADLPDNAKKITENSAKLKELGVEIVDSVDALISKVDVVLLESVDGRPHLSQVTPVLKAKKKVFIDKPVGGSLADTLEIFRLAKENDVPIFSSSALRYCTGIAAARTDPKFGDILGCDAFSPCALEEHHPDLFWYGIHGVEALFTIMGPGCVSVSRTQTKDCEMVVGTWKDGRIGTFRGLRVGKHDYGATVFGSKAIAPTGGFTGYGGLVVEIAKFFKTGKSPVSADETIEIYAFMEAADQSKRDGGKPVTLESVLGKAKK
jgi:predicted dehydrogenase